jgi:zinc-finger protein CreA/MIG
MSQASSAMNDTYNGYQDQAIPFDSEPLLSFEDASEESSPRPDSATDAATEPKRRHPCLYCEKSFTTSGHLARHTRTHTGERKHVCPFPGCDTKCSRADNLQQQ